MRLNRSIRQIHSGPALLHEPVGGAQDHGAELALLDDGRAQLVKVEVLPLDALMLRHSTCRHPFLRFPYCLRVAHPGRLDAGAEGAR